jgi:hypothetical protein
MDMTLFSQTAQMNDFRTLLKIYHAMARCPFRRDASAADVPDAASASVGRVNVYMKSVKNTMLRPMAI